MRHRTELAAGGRTLGVVNLLERVSCAVRADWRLPVLAGVDGARMHSAWVYRAWMHWALPSWALLAGMPGTLPPGGGRDGTLLCLAIWPVTIGSRRLLSRAVWSLDEVPA
jgi:hypothetical protein